MATKELAQAVESAVTAMDAAEAAEVAYDVSSIDLPDGKVSLDPKAIGVGILIGLGVVGVAYGGYRLFKYLKNKNTEDKKEA